jgi:PAS domain S-box-containing protein
MSLPRYGRAWWRFLAWPLTAWLVLCGTLVSAVLWAQRSSERDLRQRFELRTAIGADFISRYVADLIERERSQAVQFLSAVTVDSRTFAQSVAAFGYPAAVLLDQDGRLLQVVPDNPDLIGQNLTARYPHLRTAVQQRRPAVSPVVPSAARGVPVVGFAVPFATPSGQRVFSGAVEVATSPLGGYLQRAVDLPGTDIYLVDTDGTVVGGSRRALTSPVKMAAQDPALASALQRDANGILSAHGDDRVFASRPVSGTSWRLVATVPRSILQQPVTSANTSTTAVAIALLVIGAFAVVLRARAARNRAALHATEKQFRDVFENSLVGMAITSTDGTVTRTNAALDRMLGYGPDELTGRPWTELEHPDDRTAGAELVYDTQIGHIPGFAITTRCLHADGHVVWVERTSTHLSGRDDRPDQLATQLVDVTEQRELQQAQRHHSEEVAARATALTRANTELEAANQRVADLVAMLTHDVRQPIAMITGYCEVLTDEWDDHDDEARRRDVGRIAATAASMNGYVEEILTLTQVDADTLFSRPAVLTAENAINDALTHLLPHQRRDVVTHVQPGLHIRCDPRQFQQMLVNLISNGLKYGDPPVVVDAVADNDEARIEVLDTGEGVPDEFVPRLFDRFARASTGNASSQKGTGLGLYIVRQLALANGGTITYRPRQPTGACFVLCLPTSIRDGPQAPVTHELTSPASFPHTVQPSMQETPDIRTCH